ncbi:MAG TPA: acyloxyacyl hydrolase, partial [Desulfoprunum sp.]|nr:acyloxyacyl hydrolase [Desulfoprunum sp.]
ILLVILVSSSCLLLMPPVADAADNSGLLHEIRVGVLDHDTNNLWSGSSYEGGTDVSAEIVLTPAYVLWNGHIRPNLGVAVNDSGATSKIYSGGVWQILQRNGWILDLGAGLAVHDGEIDNPKAVNRKELGSRILFHVSLELGYPLSAHNRIYLMFDHVSNGYTADPNEGLDTLGIRYGYLF